ncbi:uncharacterized protein LOC121878888 [Homarus americanus]|uniref:Putative Insect cuticle protein domain-containing protein 2 n=1 Tax=Homarus americanus TaxID=6706 RepID=A0A8J5JPG8_HOMAM|nr:uncharacterized protein LOC121878888 [Homarus americanus]KAG7158353.1 putative Insect cuticle protein domain-containing protein 2 [Homarus americanus]
MASTQLLLLSLVVMAATGAPQLGVDSDQPPTPYDFGYGVNVADTGDAKEHKETVSPSGRTEGEYRWLQPNGLYRVVRYYVEGDSGFQAEVSEEPGSEIANYYSNSLSQESSSGAVSSQGFAKSFDSSQSTLGAAINVVSAPQPSRNRQSSFRPTQRFQSQQRPSFNTQQQPSFNTQQRQSFTSQQQPSFNTQQRQSFTSQQESNSNIIDGGFIDGGIIDGGFIDGGTIDGGIIDGGYIN